MEIVVLSCVFIATHAITQLQMTNMNVLAPTLGEMLFRELEYEYVGVRGHVPNVVHSSTLHKGIPKQNAKTKPTPTVPTSWKHRYSA